MTVGRAGQAGPGDGRAAHPAAAEDGHASRRWLTSPVNIAAPEAGHDPAPEQSDRLGPGPAVDLGALTGGHERLLGEGPDAEGG